MYDIRQEQTGNWTPFEQTDRDGRWPYVEAYMSAATYQNPKGSVGYVTFFGQDQELYIGSPQWGNSGPLPKPDQSHLNSSNNLATESYVIYRPPPVLNSSQLVFVDFAQVMGIVPFTSSAFQVLQTTTPFIGDVSAAAKDFEGLWMVCGWQPYGEGVWTVQQLMDGAGIHWSDFSRISLDDVDASPFGLCLLNEELYMFLTDGPQISVMRQQPRKRPPEWPAGDWQPVLSLGAMPSQWTDLSQPLVITAPGNYFMVFWISSVGQLWRGRYDGAQDPITWENAGAPPGATLLIGGYPALAVSIGTTGNIEVFAVSVEGDLWQMWYTTETGVWSDWYSHGQPSD